MNFSEVYKYGMMFCYKATSQSSAIYNISNGNKLLNIRYFLNRKSKYSTAPSNKIRIKSSRNYAVALGVLTLGGTFAAVPLYRIFCQATGFGGTVQHDLGGKKIEKMKTVPYRKISVKFVSDVSSNLSWKFEPQQNELMVLPGETALAFYTATNPLDRPVIGISTYNVLPFEAAQYFNKIQCFCFEEQQLNPQEKVDLPVFFYIDPEFCEDPMMENINQIILSYTFFQVKDSAVKNVEPVLQKSK